MSKAFKKIAQTRQLGYENMELGEDVVLDTILKAVQFPGKFIKSLTG